MSSKSRPFEVNHPAQILQRLNLQRSKEDFCDLVLKINGRLFQVHKCIMSASSSYFEAMFHDGMVESNADIVTLQDVDPAVFEVLLDFIYTGELKLTEGNWQDVFLACNMFQLNSAVDLCCDFIIDKLHPSNCLGVLELASIHNCTNLSDVTQEYVYQHFVDVASEEEFLSLSVDILCELLSSENIHIDEEHQTLKAAVYWFEQDANSRLKYLRRVLTNVRFPFITPSALSRILDDCTCKALKQQLAIVVNELNETQLESGERTAANGVSKKETNTLSLWCYPRLSSRRNIFVVGGHFQEEGKCLSWNSNSSSLNSCECYSTYLKKWQTVSPMHYARTWHGSCRLNGMIYVAGGENESLIFNSVECFDPQTNRWTVLKDMIMPRCGLGLCALGGKLYAFGGWVGSEIGLSVESYSPKDDTWEIVDSMATPRYAMGVAAYGDEIFLVGGMSDLGDELKSMESYNPISQQWNQYSSMPLPRAYVGVVVIDDSLFVVGGSRDNEVLDTVEKWSFFERKWTSLPPLLRPRTEAAVVAANGTIYVVGGREVTNGPTLNTMDCFDIKTRTWRPGPPLEIGRSETGAIVL